jgi:hypothetical protein
MSTRELAVALRTELVALVAGPTDPPSHGSRGSAGSAWGVGVLPVLMGMRVAHRMWVRISSVLMERMDRIRRRWSERLQPVGVHVCLGEVAAGHEGVGRNVVVRGEAVERIG